jgi:putative glycosyltransferase (TIGR04372 family)
LIEIRIGRINNKVIGHFAMELDASVLLNKQKTSIKPILNIFFFAHDSSVNKYFEQLVRERFNLLPLSFLEFAYAYFVSQERFHKHIIPTYDFNSGLVIPNSKKLESSFWVKLAGEPPLLSNGCKEKLATEKLLVDLKAGFEEFACFHIRDSGFKTKELFERGFSSQHIILNSARTEYRNSDISNFDLAAQYLISRGISPIRVGKDMKLLNNSQKNFLVDYSYSGLRNDRNDLLLAANCKFMVCTLSGFSEVSKLFRVPIFYIDLGEFSYFASKVNSSVTASPIILPKVIKFRRNGKILSFEEIKYLDIYQYSVVKFEEYISDPNCPIQVEENSPEVILNSIQLGLNYLDNKSKDLTEMFNYGQRLYANLYDIAYNSSVPSISPYWPNALQTN